MSEQENKHDSDLTNDQSKSQANENNQSIDSAKVHIEPSEPKNLENETGNQSGDPGRTPGKAEG